MSIRLFFCELLVIIVLMSGCTQNGVVSHSNDYISSAAQPSSTDSPEALSSQPKSSQNLSFHAEYMRQTVSQYGYIDSQGKLHWNPDFLNRELKAYGLDEFIAELKKLEQKSGAVSFAVDSPFYITQVLWQDGTMTYLIPRFTPFGGEEVSSAAAGKIYIKTVSDVSAILSGHNDDSVYLQKDGTARKICRNNAFVEDSKFYPDEVVATGCLQLDADGNIPRELVLRTDGKLEEKSVQDCTDDFKTEISSLEKIVQVAVVNERFLLLCADGSLYAPYSKDGIGYYAFDRADERNELPAQTDILRLFPGTPWFLAADGTLYNADPQQGKTQKLANQTGIDQIFSAGDGWCALKTDSTIVGLAGTEPDEWLAGLKNVMVVTK